MKQYIDKDTLVTELEKRKSELHSIIAELDTFEANTLGLLREVDLYDEILSMLDAIEIKEIEENSLEKFKSLQHITKDLHQTLEDWGYAPNLYFFDVMWHVSWISCEEGDSIKDFEGNTPEEAIDKACGWFHSTFCNS